MPSTSDVAPRRARLGPADRRRPEPSDRHVQTRDDAAPRARRRSQATRRAADDGAARDPVRGAARARRTTARDGRSDPPRRPARPARQRRPSPLSRRRPDRRTPWDELWGLENTGQELYQGEPGTGGTADADIDGRQALGITTGDPATVVAVIDDGVDFSHPDLAARAWTNPGESGGGTETNGIDDDGNGYIDDVHGWDFCHDDNTVHDFDDDYHGTHVAGTIAASLDGVGVVGVAPNVSIMALKFIERRPRLRARLAGDRRDRRTRSRSGSRSPTPRGAAAGGRGRRPSCTTRSRRRGCSSSPPPATTATTTTRTRSPSLPASFDLPNILSVAAIDNSGGLAGFSNYGATTVDIAAPGEAILSALPADRRRHPRTGLGLARRHLDGRAPRERHGGPVASAFPALAADPAALKARLLSTGKPMPATAGQTAHRPAGRCVPGARHGRAARARRRSSFAFDVGLDDEPHARIATRVGWPSATDDRSGVAAYGAAACRPAADRGSTAVGATTARTRDANAHVRNDVRLPRPRP